MFVAGKNRLGLELDAKRREAVEFANSSRLDPNKFSISFWIKDAKNPQPYGVVISHTNRNETAGWSLDAHAMEHHHAICTVFPFLTKEDNGLCHLMHPFRTIPLPI